MSRFFSPFLPHLQKHFSTSVSNGYRLREVLDSIRDKRDVVKSLNRVLYNGDSRFHESYNESLRLLVSQINARIPHQATDTDLQIQALKDWNNAKGVVGIYSSLHLTFPPCDANGMPSDLHAFLFGQTKYSSHTYTLAEQDLIRILPSYLRVLNDISRNKISREHYDGNPVYGPTEAQHGTQAFLNALFVLDFFDRPNLQKLLLALGAYQHDMARLLHSEESQGREIGHRQHHTEGKILLRIFGCEVYFFAELHTLMKVLLCDLHTPYQSVVLSRESLSSFTIQREPDLLKKYRQVLWDYNDPIFYATIALYFRFLCDECAKPNERICHTNRFPINLTQRMQLQCLSLKSHIRDCLDRGITPSNIAANLLMQIAEATQLIKAYKADRLSANSGFYRDLYQAAGALIPSAEISSSLPCAGR